MFGLYSNKIADIDCIIKPEGVASVVQSLV